MDVETRANRFAATLAKLAASCRQELDDLTLEVYTEALSPLVDPAEWDEFVMSAIRAGRFGAFRFPATAELLEALAEFRGSPRLEAEAGLAYERVLEASTRGHDGTFWDQRKIAETCGRAAREAFMAAGGNSAFATTWNESKRREQFIATYLRAAREEPSSRLLPAGDRPKELPTGAELVQITAGEAQAAMGKIRELVGAVDRPAPREARAIVVANPDRVRMLQAQARQIADEQPKEDS